MHFKIHVKIIHFISLMFYKDAYLLCAYIVIMTDAKKFFLKYCFTIIVHIRQT